MLGRERTRDVARARLGNVLREDRTADQAHITVSRDRGAGRSLLEFTVPIRSVRRRR